MADLGEMRNFYKDKRVLVTGHTGFKGAWLCRLLLDMGAKVYGYALAPERKSLYGLLNWEKGLVSCYGDICQPKKLAAFVKKAEPEVVFHLAAQPLVSEGYAQPVRTYETNLMGTVYLLEALRQVERLRSVVVVTTDKVYAETKEAAGEESPLDGFDPYANSKSCAELAAACYGRCFLQGKAALSRLRAGNVIGGGDFAAHRILPDCIRAAVERKPVVLRHPEGVRPYQHVLEPLTAYLWTAWKQWEKPELSDCYNVAPKGKDISNGELAGLFCKYWGNGMTWQAERTDFPREQAVLRLNGEKIQEKLGWTPRWNVEQAVSATVAWTKVWQRGGDLTEEMRREAAAYEKGEWI